MDGEYTPTPPLLVLIQAGSTNPLSSYVLEILAIEGLFAHDVIDLATTSLPGVPLERYETVLLCNVDLSSGDEELLRGYVARGGNLIASRPPKSLADLFGLRPNGAIANTRVKDRYIVISDEHPLSAELPCRSLQFHGDMDLFIPEDANVLAYAAGDLEEPTGFSAISTRVVGEGRVAAFAYDLATTVVRLHQGKPENASTGANPDPDGDDRWAPNDLFVDQLDPRLKFVPQADVHQDLLVRIVYWMSESRRPVPRVWYFPDAAPCVAYINGDSDGMDRESYDAVRSLVEEYGGRFTLYLLEHHHHLFDASEIGQLREKGHAFGHHADIPMKASVEEAQVMVGSSISSFESAYGYRPLTTRGHCLVWPGWTDMAEALMSNGVRMDQDFIPRRFLQHGYLNGSGLPVRFMREDGEMLDIYEQNTQITDDGSVEEDKFLIRTGSPEGVLRTALHMLDDCIDRFHGVYQAAFHPHFTRQRAIWLLKAVLERCQERDIPMVNGDAWVRFNDARRKVRLFDVSFDGERSMLHFLASAERAIHGLTLMVPAEVASAQVASIDVDCSPSSFTFERLKGKSYALVVVDIRERGRISIDAQYR